MSATKMRFLSSRNSRLLSPGRSALLAGGSAGGPGVRSLICPPLSPSSAGRALSSLSTARCGLPKEKMTENGMMSRTKVLTIDTMNPVVKKVEYAVRGPIVQRAVELEKELNEVWSSLPPGLSACVICHLFNTKLSKNESPLILLSNPIEEYRLDSVNWALE